MQIYLRFFSLPLRKRATHQYQHYNVQHYVYNIQNGLVRRFDENLFDVLLIVMPNREKDYRCREMTIKWKINIDAENITEMQIGQCQLLA
ncbi:MAG TPA: hypothetical protein VK982_06650 [Bacteroidales bacterium]|nr:hypothetical protein [Bacteroidales bacterium]